MEFKEIKKKQLYISFFSSIFSGFIEHWGINDYLVPWQKFQKCFAQDLYYFAIIKPIKKN